MNDSITTYAEAATETKEIDDEQLLRYLQQMDVWRFEEFIAKLWRRKGWDTEVEGGSNDCGIDVRATQSYPYEQKVLIQAKRYGPTTTVGSSDIQQYASLAHQEDGVDKVAIVTTNEFTRQARKLADQLNVKTIDGDRLVHIIREEDALDLATEYLPFDGEHVGDGTRTDRGESKPKRGAGAVGGAIRSVLSRVPSAHENVENASWFHLSDDEEVRWTGRPSLLTIVPQLAVALTVILIGIVVTVFTVPFVGEQGLPTTFGYAPLALAVIGVVLAVVACINWLRILYVITSEAIYVKYGLISRDVTQIRLDRIQNTAYDQTILERLLAIGDVEVYTAGTSTEDLVFRTVRRPEQIKGTLTQLLGDHPSRSGL